MLSLYSALLAQHARQLTPVRCAEQTVAQLQRYFEDVVLENNLGALVVECLLPEAQRAMREIARVREIAVNRIATAIRSSLELPSVLQTTVNEVGRALGAQQSALSVAGEHGQPSLNTCYFRDGDGDEGTRAELLGD